MADFADIKEVTTKALQVQKIYFTKLDGTPENRAELRQMYYPSPSHTLMQWNGHVLATLSDIEQYHANLPKTKHVVQSVDAQPLPGNSGGDSFMVVVSGTCTYDDEHVRHFYQRLVMTKHEGRMYIVNDYQRWTGEG